MWLSDEAMIQMKDEYCSKGGGGSRVRSHGKEAIVIVMTTPSPLDDLRQLYLKCKETP